MGKFLHKTVVLSHLAHICPVYEAGSGPGASPLVYYPELHNEMQHNELNHINLEDMIERAIYKKTAGALQSFEYSNLTRLPEILSF